MKPNFQRALMRLTAGRTCGKARAQESGAFAMYVVSKMRTRIIADEIDRG